MKTVKIRDYYGKEQTVPVSDEVYEGRVTCGGRRIGFASESPTTGQG